MTAGAPKIPTLPRMPELKGLCTTGRYNPELWTPDNYTSDEDKQRVEATKAICRACPGRQACLDHILEREGNAHLDQRHGIWGGTTPKERYNHVKQQQKRRRDLAAAA